MSLLIFLGAALLTSTRGAEPWSCPVQSRLSYSVKVHFISFMEVSPPMRRLSHSRTLLKDGPHNIKQSVGALGKLLGQIMHRPISVRCRDLRWRASYGRRSIRCKLGWAPESLRSVPHSIARCGRS